MQSESEEAPFPFELKSICSSQMMPNGLSERTVVIDISTNGPLDFPSPKKTQSLVDESGRRYIRRRKVVTNQPRKEPDAPLPNARPLKPIRVAEVVENLNRLVETTSYSSGSSYFRSDTSHYYTSAGRNQSSSGSHLDSRTQVQTTINSKYGQDQRSGSPKLELTEARIVYEKDAKKKRSPQTKNSIMQEAELDYEESLADSSADADLLRFPKQRKANRSDESSDEPPTKRRKSPERSHRSSRRNKHQRFESESSESYESEEDRRKSHERRRSPKKSHGKEPKEDREEDDDRRRTHKRSSQRRRRSPSDSSDEYERHSTRRRGSPQRSRRRHESESDSDEWEVEIRRYRTKRHSPKRSTRRRREVTDYSDEERPRKRRGSSQRRRHQVSDSYESSDDRRKKELSEYSDEEGSEKKVAKKEVNETQSMVNDNEEVTKAEAKKGVVADQQTEEEQANEEPAVQEDKTHEEESVHEEEEVNEKGKDEEKPHLEEEELIVEAEEEQKEKDKSHSNGEEDAIDKAKEERKDHSNEEEEAIEKAKEENKSASNEEEEKIEDKSRSNEEEEVIEKAKEENKSISHEEEEKIEDKGHSHEEEEALEKAKEENKSVSNEVEEKIEEKSGADKEDAAEEEKGEEKQSDESDSNEENAIENPKELHEEEEEQHNHESGAEDENQSHKSNSSSSTESKPQSPIIVTDELTKSVSLEHDESLHLDELESDSHDEQDILFRPYGRKETTGSFRERSYGLKTEQQTFSHTIGPTSRKLLDGSKSLSSSVELSVKEIHPSSIVYGDSSVWMFLPLDLSGTEDYQKKETDDGKVTLPPNFSRVVVILDHSFGQENRESLLVPISRAMSPYKSEHFAILVENAESENPNCVAVYTFGYCGDKCTKIWGTGQDNIDISTIRAYWQYKWDKHVFVADEGLGEKTVAFSV